MAGNLTAEQNMEASHHAESICNLLTAGNQSRANGIIHESLIILPDCDEFIIIWKMFPWVQTSLAWRVVPNCLPVSLQDST